VQKVGQRRSGCRGTKRITLFSGIYEPRIKSEENCNASNFAVSATLSACEWDAAIYDGCDETSQISKMMDNKKPAKPYGLRVLMYRFNNLVGRRELNPGPFLTNQSLIYHLRSFCGNLVLFLVSLLNPDKLH
jgi:hypothetical protein